MFIPILGKISIYAATVFAVAAAITYLFAWRGKDRLKLWGRRFFILTAGSIFIAVISLLQSILTHNFAVSYVYNYSSTDLPLYYLISTFWAGQEGTYLLWIFYASILGLILARRSGKFESGNILFLCLFLLSVLLILIKRSPFTLLATTTTEGAGLNPLLQNYWMTIHPLVMFVGFAATVIPFVFALTALISKEFDSWTEFVFPWALLSFVSLGAALVMGGFWAYETLGWGGYWAWDPVENSSLIPWIFSAGLVHTLIIHRKKNALKRTGLALAILAFLSVTYGTFLTRSGVLGDFSVHSFLDLGINSYLIGAVLLFAGLGAVTFLLRFRQIKTEPTSGNWFSREFLIFGNILATILSAFLIILGMSSPLLTRWFGTPASVRTDFYNVSITPIVILFTLLLGLLPAVGWGENDRKLFWKNIRLPLMLSVPVAIAIFIGKVKEPLYLVFVFLSVLAFFSNGRIVLLKLKTGKLAGAFLAHCGMALLLLGVIFSNVYESRARIGLVAGEPQQALGYSFTYLGKDSNSPQGKTPHKILVQKGSEEFTAAPRQFFSAYSQGIMRTPYIERYWNKDLYIAPIEEIDYSITEETFNLEKGKAFEKSGYTFTYLDGDLSSHQTGTAQTFTAQIQVRHGEEIEKISPGLIGQGMNWKQEPARFNHDRAIVYLEGFQPGENSLAVRFIGQSANTSEVPQPGFAIEVSVKPFINLFWGGAILVVIGGILSLLKRWKALRKSGSQSNEAERVPVQPVARTLTGV